MKYAVGVDVGGTNIRIAIVDEQGNLLKVIKQSTKTGGSDILIEQIVELYHQIDAQSYKIEGLGIGVPGPVADGTVIYIPNLQISNSFDLKNILQERLHVPVFVGNDANVAALAEAEVGSGQGYNVVQYITLSTGIGGGLVMNHKMITGQYGFAQEVGSMIINIGGLAPSPYKANGCIEGEASGTMLTYKANKIGLNCAHAGEVFEKAHAGDEDAIKLKEEFIDYIAAFIGSIVAYMEPDIFVLGGGMMKSSDYFLEELIKKVDDYVYFTLKGKIKIVKAMHDQDCGIIGAAMQCFTNL